MARQAPTRKPKPTTEVSEVQILELSQGEVSFCVIGTEMLVLNSMSQKVIRVLLTGSTKKNEAEKAANQKHDLPTEFRNSVYRNPGPKPATRLCFPSSAFKGVLRTAALDMPGATKTAIGRRVWVPGRYIDIYGIPTLGMDHVKSADIARTPDIRTRACLLEWCCEVKIRFVRPLVTVKQLTALFAAGGLVSGIGDWRQEKGSGNCGMFRLCDRNDPDFKRIQKEGGRAAQDAALEHITFRDPESEDHFRWHTDWVAKKGKDEPEPANDADRTAEAAD